MRKRGREDGNRPHVKLASSKVRPLAPHRSSRGCFGSKLLEDSLSLSRARPRVGASSFLMEVHDCAFLQFGVKDNYFQMP